MSEGQATVYEMPADFSESLIKALTGALSIDPVDIAARAFAVISLMDENSESNTEGVQGLLLSCWECFSAGRRVSPVKRATDKQILHEYFTHRGDWRAMKTCLLSGVREVAPTRVQEWEEKVAKYLLDARQQFEAAFGNNGVSV
ncbi:MAG TPA: hypothetical protein VI653_07315 [Steroidobacteraceae bacterium]